MLNGLHGYDGAGGSAADLQTIGKRATAELINGLNGFEDTNFLTQIGKRATAELVNSLGMLGNDYGDLARIGKRGTAELLNGLYGMDTNDLHRLG